MRLSVSRRAFLAVAGVSAHLWLPRPVRGYRVDDVLARSDGDIVRRGLSKWELDTPALCVDLDAMERNVATMQAAMKKYGLESRPQRTQHVMKTRVGRPGRDAADLGNPFERQVEVVVQDHHRSMFD